MPQSTRRGELFEDFVKVTKQQHLVSPFSVNGTSPAMCVRFLRISEDNALRELVSEDVPPSCIGSGGEEERYNGTKKSNVLHIAEKSFDSYSALA